ncbi:MAG: M20 family metallopeptidase, partial [Calditrichia bacterium]
MQNAKIEEEIGKIIEQLYPVLSDFRNDLHRNPELSWQEFRTTQKIDEILKEYGLPTLVKPLETGGYIDFEYNPDAPYVLLRSDIDALPITDLKNTSHSSQNNGVCHACGHDVHTTIIVGLGILLQKLNISLPYNIRLVFQPAEEPIPGGASKMIPTGILNKVRYAIGIHVDPRIEVGTISLTKGWVNMQSIRLDLEITGTGGHSAYPFKTQDIIWVASRLIQDSLQMINREFDALYEPLILTFTEIRSGEGYNVIPAKLSLTGTIRLSEPKLRERFIDKFQRLLTAYEAT